MKRRERLTRDGGRRDTLDYGAHSLLLDLLDRDELCFIMNTEAITSGECRNPPIQVEGRS